MPLVTLVYKVWHFVQICLFSPCQFGHFCMVCCLLLIIFSVMSLTRGHISWNPASVIPGSILREKTMNWKRRTGECLYFIDVGLIQHICAKKKKVGVPAVAQQKRTWLVSMRMLVRALALLSGLKIHGSRGLWCRSPMLLRSCVAMAAA